MKYVMRRRNVTDVCSEINFFKGFRTEQGGMGKSRVVDIIYLERMVAQIYWDAGKWVLESFDIGRKRMNEIEKHLGLSYLLRFVPN